MTEELYEKILQAFEQCGCPLDHSHAELAAKAVAEHFENLGPWAPTGWWRSLLPDGSLWAESSSESDVRQRARRGGNIQRHMRRIEEKWEDA